MILEQKELKYKNKLVFEKLVMSSNFRRVPKLFSEDEACFLFLTKGAFQFRTPTNLLTFNEGDAMLSKCGNYFIEQVSLSPKSEHQVIAAVGAFFYPAMVREFFQNDLSLKKFQSQFDTTKVSVEPLLKAFLESINFLFENPSLVDDNLIVTKLKELLLLLSKTEKAASIHEFVNGLFVPHEYDFNEIIQKNLYTNLSLEELAHLSNCSLATFKRKFASVYGESPARYLLGKKLDYSKELLLIKNRPVSEIAFECGFETVSSFNKSFKRKYKQSPSEYRLSQNDNHLD